MAIEFLKVGNKVVISADDHRIGSVPVDAAVIADPNLPDVVLITNSIDQNDNREALRINWTNVTSPVVESRDDLIDQLTADFFFRIAVSGGGAFADVYQVPAEEITGTENTFTIPWLVDTTKPLIAINGKFSETIYAGIASVTPGVSDTVIVFDENIPVTNVLVIYYTKQ